MAAPKNETDIRIQFKHFDENVLLTLDEVRQLIGAGSAGAVYAALYRGDLPEPLIRRNRQLRWSAGQMRGYFQTLEADFKKRQLHTAAGRGIDIPTEEKKRFGKPRKEVRPFSDFEKA